jgi:hypothetical protein
MCNYSHTLIAGRADFVPNAEQVRAFLESLTSIGATPIDPTLRFMTHSGKFRVVRNPFTDGTRTLPEWTGGKVDNFVGLPNALNGLEMYNVLLHGAGPPAVQPFAFELDYRDAYDYEITCSVRKEVVSTSDWHDEARDKRQVPFFGQPCSPEDRLGIFLRPNDLTVIEVPDAGCARFWVEFECGRLFPPITDRLDLLHPAIVRAAEQAFEIPMVQGCRWGA